MGCKRNVEPCPCGSAIHAALEIDATLGVVFVAHHLGVHRGQVEESGVVLAAADALGDGIPESLTALIKVPADISEMLRDSLLEQANSWLASSKPLLT